MMPLAISLFPDTDSFSLVTSMEIVLALYFASAMLVRALMRRRA